MTTPSANHRLLNFVQSALLLGLIAWIAVTAIAGPENGLLMALAMGGGLIFAPAMPRRLLLSTYQAQRLTLADFQVGRVKPEVGPCPFQWSGQEGVHALVDLGAEPADLAPGHAARAHGLNQIVDRTGRNAVDVGLLDHRHLLGGAAWLEEAREVAALAQLRDLQRDLPRSRVPVAVPVAIALNFTHRRSRALGRTRPGLHLSLHDAPGRKGQHLAHEIAVSLLLTSSISAILSSVIVISVLSSRCCNPNLFRRSAVTAGVTHGRALRYAKGSARGLLHHHPGHCRLDRPGCIGLYRWSCSLQYLAVEDCCDTFEIKLTASSSIADAS